MAPSFALLPALTPSGERVALQRYLDSVAKADAEQETQIDQSAETWFSPPFVRRRFEPDEERVTPEAMRLRRCTVEHPFAAIKYRIFGHPRLLMRGLTGARAEIGIATMAYNPKRITNVLGAAKLTKELLHAR